MIRRTMMVLVTAAALAPLAAWAQESAPAPTAAPAAAPTAAPTATPAVTPAATPELKPAQPIKESGTGAVTPPPTSQPAGGQSQTPCAGMDMKVLVPLMVVMVLMYVWMGRKKKKEEKARKDLLGALKKGDKVTTIGGIIGTVIEVKPDEVTVKTDETNNVRMKFARWAIRDVGEPKGDKPDQEKK